MNTHKSGWMFAGGILCGLGLALCLGAAPKAKEAAKKDWSHLQIFSYPNGGTGIFDPDTATFYSYDSDLINCYQIREITSLGGRMIVRR